MNGFYKERGSDDVDVSEEDELVLGNENGVYEVERVVEKRKIKVSLSIIVHTLQLLMSVIFL